MAVDNKVDSNTVDPKASATDEAAATDVTNDELHQTIRLDDPNVEDANEDS